MHFYGLQSTQCAYDSEAENFFPVCPANIEEGLFCDGDSRNCGTYLCDCPDGVKMCRGNNPCEVKCEVDTSDNINKPVCPGSNTFCNGDSDCDDERLGRCNCDVGEMICGGTNVCSQPTASPTVR